MLQAQEIWALKRDFRSRWRNYLQKNQDGSGSESSRALMVKEVIPLVEMIVDSGASAHVVCNR